MLMMKQRTIFTPAVTEVGYWNGARDAALWHGAVRVAETRLVDAPDPDAQRDWLRKWRAIGPDWTPSIDQYLSLMSRPDVPSLDISKRYCLLPQPVIAQLRAKLPPASKVIYLVRNPMTRQAARVERQFFARRKYRGLPAAADLEDFLSNGESKRFANYPAVIRDWRAVFGDDLIVLSCEALHANPAATLKQLGQALDVDLEATEIDENPDRLAQFTPTLGARETRMIAAASRHAVPGLMKSMPDLATPWRDEITTSLASHTGAARSVEVLELPVLRMMRVTESLGDNCEYGFWQRHRGYEPSSLFRWAITPIDSLLAFLRKPGPLYALDQLSPHSPGMVSDATFGFKFHSKLVERDEDGKLVLQRAPNVLADLHARELSKINFLYSKFLFHLTRNPGLYVVKKNGGIDRGRVDDLLAELRRRHAGHWLLWVEEDEGSPAHLERLAPGLLRGSVPRFAPYSAADSYDTSGWSALMRAVALHPALASVRKWSDRRKN